jgi:CcmD family protein
VDGGLIFLFAAVVVIWVAVFIYLLNISGRLTALRRELDALERPDRDPGGDNPSKRNPRNE